MIFDLRLMTYDFSLNLKPETLAPISYSLEP